MTVKRTEEIAEGDRLAEDLVNAQGAVLIPAGCELEEKHVRLLKMWGVDTIHIADRGAAFASPDEPSDALLDEAEAIIKERFGESLDNEIMAEILRVAVCQLARKLARTGVGNNG